MADDRALARLARAHGIVARYRDMAGETRTASPDTLRALLAASGVAAGTRADVKEALAAFDASTRGRKVPEEVIVEADTPASMVIGPARGWRLVADGADTPVLEGGRFDGPLDLPALSPDVYLLTVETDPGPQIVRIISAPRHAPSVAGQTGHDRIWGMNLALWGLQSRRNAGLGDYDDLAAAARAVGMACGDFLGTNPLHAMGQGSDAFSPYSPTHRGFLNTRHIALDAIPGIEGVRQAQAVRAEQEPAFATLRGKPHVDHMAHRDAHGAALHRLYRVFQAHATDAARDALAEFTQAGGDDLRAFAGFEALAEDHGPDWRAWPRDARPDPQRTGFHLWLQWVADHQLGAAQRAATAAGMGLGLYLDLAVGARRDGAESWCNSDVIAQGVSVGAPPDHLSPEGQNWALCAYAPGRLASQNYRPFRRLLRAVMQHAGIVRIDHVLGLARSFWIPDDGSPGGYVTQPLDALLALVRIEAARHGTVVVGEDLGLVPKGFRKTLQASGIYGYSVMQYERDTKGRLTPPQRTQVLSCFSTHDTPTARGFERGRDIDWWLRLGWTDRAGAKAARGQRRRDVETLKGDDPGADFTDTVHARLAASAAAMVTVQLDDVLRHEDAQNLPGTTDEHMNWQNRYGVPVDALADDSRLKATAHAMNAGRARPASCSSTEVIHDT